MIEILKNPFYFWVGSATALGLFSFNYYLMATLPGEADFQCKIGAGLTGANLIFAFVLSLMAGGCVSGLIALLKNKFETVSSGGSALAGLGALTGVLTTFCTLCTLPVVTLFGSSVGFGFFTDYNSYFKVSSIVLMAIALYLINRRLKHQCSVCRY